MMESVYTPSVKPPLVLPWGALRVAKKTLRPPPDMRQNSQALTCSLGTS